MMSGAVVKVKCPECSRFVHPNETVPVGQFHFRCLQCRDRHTVQLEAIGEPPERCPECGKRFEDLRIYYPNLGPTRSVPMYQVLKDGIYQLLCGPCERAYVLKRQDLYGNTPFGRARGVK